MQSDLMKISLNPTNKEYRVNYKTLDVWRNISPVLYYNENWLSEKSGEIKPINYKEEPIENFEDNDFFGGCTDYQKHYKVAAEEGPFSIILHLYCFQKWPMIYVNLEFKDNGAYSDYIGGYIDLGIPANTEAYRFFHGYGDWKEKLVAPKNPSNNFGMGFFQPRQNAWQEPCFLNEPPNNENLPISYLMGKLSNGHCFGVVPTNRFGQQSLIRSCELLDFPLGLKIVSGNFVPRQKYDHLAGALILFGEDPIHVSEEIFTAYMRLLNRPYVLREFKEYPEMFEYLGFCTWNTFYAAVDIQGIRDLAQENFTKDSGSDRFKYLIIDDGWQSVNGCDLTAIPTVKNQQIPRGLTYFEANHKFPKGLKEVAQIVKDEYGIKWLGVWHAVGGYWPGVEPNSPLGQKYSLLINGGSAYPNPENMKGYEFWVDYYKYMRSSGIDLVKIDNQCSLPSNFYGKLPMDYAMENYYLMQQGAAYAQNVVILNCMCMASDNKLHWTKSNVSRVSDDFYPGNLPACKHQIKQCTFNPLYYARFCWPDHDMCQTSSDAYHPLLLMHMVSGGPIYIADEVGETKSEVINKISFPDGKLPRLDRPGVPTIDAIFGNDHQNMACKMGNYHDLAGWGRIFYYYAGNMILEQKPLEVTISLSDLGKILTENLQNDSPNALFKGPWVIFNHDKGNTAQLSSIDSKITTQIDNLKAEYFAISPLVNSISLIGLKGIYNPSKAINKCQWKGPNRLFITVNYPGQFLIYVENGKKIEAFTLDGTSLTTAQSKGDRNIWEISVSEKEFYITC
jgi:hypothetical protein